MPYSTSGCPRRSTCRSAASNLEKALRDRAADRRAKSASFPASATSSIPQDIDYPALAPRHRPRRGRAFGLSAEGGRAQRHHRAHLQPDDRAELLGRSARPATTTCSRSSIPEDQIKTLSDLSANPAALGGQRRLHAARLRSSRSSPSRRRPRSTTISCAASSTCTSRRTARTWAADRAIDRIVAGTKLPEGVRVDLRGSVQGMRASFKSFGLGLILSVVLVYLILVAQFRRSSTRSSSCSRSRRACGRPLILLAHRHDAQRDVADGMVMMVGIVVSNSILIVDFARRLREDGFP